MSTEQLSESVPDQQHDTAPGPLPTSPEACPGTGKSMRARWLANKRQELLAPAAAILDLCEMLLKDVRDRAQESLAKDLEQINACASRFLAMVKEVLDPAQSARAEADFGGRVRHDLRSPLTAMIGLCELWLEDAEELLLGGFVADLQKIHDLCRQLLSSLEDLLNFNQVATGAATGVQAAEEAIFRGLESSLPSLDRDGVRSAQSGRILVVDDNEVNRDILARRLARQGHTVALAHDGRQALELLRMQQFDLVLLDIIMPELNGFQVLETLKANVELRHIPVIMISALSEIDSVARCIEKGAEDYLTKPFNPVVLRARIDACLEKKRFRDRELEYLLQIKREQERADHLLHVILPRAIVDELKLTDTVLPRRHENVAVMFCDIVGFTPYCDGNAPEQVVRDLQKLIESWEEIALKHRVEKIKTIGDAFMAAGGLLETLTENPLLPCIRCGLEMIATTRHMGSQWNLRVGLHVGPVVAGVIGRRQYLFDLWGDTVNTAARMESHGIPGHITLSGPAWQQIRHCCRGESRGQISIKGKGLMEMVRFDSFVTGGE